MGRPEKVICVHYAEDGLPDIIGTYKEVAAFMGTTQKNVIYHVWKDKNKPNKKWAKVENGKTD